MTTKKTQKVTAIWRLRVPVDLVKRVKQLAEQEGRSTTKQAAKLLEQAMEER